MLAFIFLLSSFGAANASAFDDFFVEFSAKRDDIQTLEARFTQENKTFEETRLSGGSIVYVKPRRIVFRYLEPEHSATYVVDGDYAFEHIPEIEQLEIHEIGDSPQSEIFFLGFEDNADRLREAYTLELFDPEGTADAAPGASRGLAIRPKPGEDEPVPFIEVRLYLREQDYLPVRIHVINDEEAETFIDISEFRINEPMAAGKAQIEVPEGTRIIEYGRVAETVGAGGKLMPGPAGDAAR